LNRVLVGLALVVSLFFFMPLASGQTTQPIKVWSDKPVYPMDDNVTVLWDANGPCIVPGASGIMTFHQIIASTAGGSDTAQLFTAFSKLSDGNLRKGQWATHLTFGSGDVGNWTEVASLAIVAPDGCKAEGSTSFIIIGQAGPAPSDYALPITLGAVIAVAVGVLLASSVRRRGKLQ
jgi:hypothetical protein